MNGKWRFEILEQIGHGQFSNVYKARWINAPNGTQQQSLLDLPANVLSPSPDFLGQTTTTGPCRDDEPFGAMGSADMILPPAHVQLFPCSASANQTTTATATTSPSQRLAGHSHQPGVSPLARSTSDPHGRPNRDQQQFPANQELRKEKFVALKRIKYYEIQNSKLRIDCLKEVGLLQQLKHPNIINYNISFIENNELFIVLDLADGGDLSKLIRYFQKRKQLISERIILKYYTQVCSAVKYIHSKRILHRDIKPANIFMTSDGCVKLGDFGLGRFFSQNTLDAHSIVGTFYYMSPERIRETGYSFSSDIWSLGCVLYELITLHSPFSIMCLESEQRQNKQRVSPNGTHEPNAQQPSLSPSSQKDKHNEGAQRQPRAQHQNPYDLQWLIDRIIRADYPSLDNFTRYSLRLRHLTSECLNPNQEARPDMDYICAVVDEAYRIQQLPPKQTATTAAILTPTSSRNQVPSNAH